MDSRISALVVMAGLLAGCGEDAPEPVPAQLLLDQLRAATETVGFRLNWETARGEGPSPADIALGNAWIGLASGDNENRTDGASLLGIDYGDERYRIDELRIPYFSFGNDAAWYGFLSRVDVEGVGFAADAGAAPDVTIDVVTIPDGEISHTTRSVARFGPVFVSSAATAEALRSLEASVESFTVRLDNLNPSIERTVAEAMGLKELRGHVEAEGELDADGTLSIDHASLGLVDLARIDAYGIFTGFEAANEPDGPSLVRTLIDLVMFDIAPPAEFADARLSRLEAWISDEGAVERALAAAESVGGLSREAVIAQAGVMAQSLAEAHVGAENAAGIGDAVRSFLQNPGSLTLSLSADEPVRLSELLAGGAQGLMLEISAGD